MRPTDAGYLALYDVASPANVLGIFDRTMDDAKRDASAHADSLVLPWFNRSWHDRARRGELAVWVVLTYVTFQIRIVVLDPTEEVRFPPFMTHYLFGVMSNEMRISCPTGKLSLDQLSDLGEPHTEALAKVPAGTYRVGLINLECGLTSEDEQTDWASLAADTGFTLVIQSCKS